MTDSVETEHKLGFFPLLGLALVYAIIPCLFLLFFSAMGFGLEITMGSQEYLDIFTVEVEVVLILIVVMYIFDEQYWPVPFRILSWSTIFAGICIGMCLLVAVLPYGPICIFSILVPLPFFAINRVKKDEKSFFPDIPKSVLVGWNYKVYVYMASIILAAFFYWCIVNENYWDAETNAEYSQKVGCAVDFTNLEECENYYAEGVPCFFDEYYEVITFSDKCTSRCLDVYQACEEAFLIWAFPNLAAMSLFVMGLISKYLANPSDPRANDHISGVAKCSAIFLFLFWIFASLAGAGEGLSSSLIAFAISMFIGSTIVSAVVFWKPLLANGRDELDELVGGVRQKVEQVETYINLVRGLVVLGFTPVIIVYLLFSMVNQFVRRFFTRHCCHNRVPDAEYEHSGYFTLTVDSQVDDFFLWDHVKVLSYAVYCGVGYVFLNVLVSKFTTVFLSGLIQYTSGMNLFAVSGIVIGVGMILFMLPPIPGLPIYLTGGIVLVSVGRDTLGVWGSISYACIVSLLLKLFACAVQQKLIGENLGGNVAVRQMVSVNSDGIRAMRVILSDKGITARKVAVLVGGPDWPVSVLCGILGLDLVSTLLGTLPVVLLIVPTVFCGSFAYMGSIQSDDSIDLYPWAETMGAVSSAFAAGVMFYFTISAAGAVKETLVKDKDEIDDIPMDEAVRQADEETARKNVYYGRVTVWSSVPLKMKFILILALLAMKGCCYLLVIFNSQCFSEYDLMYTISQHLGGNWTNIMLPLGRVAMLLFAIACALLYYFESWATTKANIMEKDDSGKSETFTSDIQREVLASYTI